MSEKFHSRPQGGMQVNTLKDVELYKRHQLQSRDKFALISYREYDFHVI